jgi:pimeloyl-ACP methyl ester carboxylesterase
MPSFDNHAAPAGSARRSRTPISFITGKSGHGTGRPSSRSRENRRRTPNVGAPPEPLFAAADRLGLRWVSFDRPGYGGSTVAPGRTVSSVAGDVAAVADALGIDESPWWGTPVAGRTPWAVRRPWAPACGRW